MIYKHVHVCVFVFVFVSHQHLTTVVGLFTFLILLVQQKKQIEQVSDFRKITTGIDLFDSNLPRGCSSMASVQILRHIKDKR